MVITNENRHCINDKELSIHDACFYSFETKFIDGKYHYTFKANDEWRPEEEFLFIFSGVTSCIYTGENHPYILGSSVNSWYSLPSHPYGTLASISLEKEEAEELDQHGIYKNSNIRKNIFVWEREYKSCIENTAKPFKVVFFFPTPSFLEVECEKMVFEKIPKN